MALQDVEIDPTDLPFLPPAPRLIVLDLPPPISVNKSRKINWASHRRVQKWLRSSDMAIMAGGGVRRLGKIPAQFEVRIILDEQQTHCDADNAAKILIDYCRRLELVVDDNKKYMRRVIIEFGEAPTGCRVVLTEIGNVTRETIGARA